MPKQSDKTSSKRNQEKIIEVVTNCEKATHEKASKVEFLPKMGILIIEAKPKLLQKIIKNSEITTATISENDDFYLK